MDRALHLALNGWGRTNPNPLVGAVVYKDGKIISEGYHEKVGGPHAEVNALEEAGKLAAGATMYVTLEPCCHYGKTPPCVNKIIEYEIKKVVIAALDPNKEVAGKGVEILRQAGIEVEVGLKEKEAKIQNEIFRKYIVTSKPFVISKWGMSLDGKIATRTGDSKWITSKQARLDTHRIRARVAGILVGIGTVLEDDPSLTCRHPEYSDHDPIRIIVDTTLKIPLDSKIMRTANSVHTIVATLDKNKTNKKVEEIKSQGGELLFISADLQGKVNLNELLESLGKQGIDSILVEGGETIHGTMIDLKLVDKFITYMGNVIIGGKKAPVPVGGKGYETLNNSIETKDMSVEVLQDTVKVSSYPTEEKDGD
ncbi:bifunctional diaminohydroxyphosphoribosylaminopyrimidine deaminase/5-amino-6-(5-phosphoribosylamino)uracil reductase RibD [Natranaerobius trueperi]|uniref:Riboflavin biosynthesis protein RibD n=1 Tax=Natranaerobius trueperi TaxID=759412 RepID=A0A226C2E5_9FIRM|nr:riboflavin biosynthesis protein RibD [Natranaerobius trueperi]